MGVALNCWAQSGARLAAPEAPEGALQVCFLALFSTLQWGKARESVFLTTPLESFSLQGWSLFPNCPADPILVDFGSGQRVVKSILTPSPSWRWLVLLEAYTVPASGPLAAQLPQPLEAAFPSLSASHQFQLTLPIHPALSPATTVSIAFCFAWFPVPYGLAQAGTGL